MANSIYDFLDEPEYNFLNNLESECIYMSDENLDQDVTFSEVLEPMTEEETVAEGHRKSTEEKECPRDTEKNRMLSEETSGMSKTEEDVRDCERNWKQVSKNILDGKHTSAEEIEKEHSEQMKYVHCHCEPLTDSKMKAVSQDDIDTEPEDYSDGEEVQEQQSFVETSKINKLKTEPDSTFEIYKILHVKTEPYSNIDISNVKIKIEPGTELETVGNYNKKPVSDSGHTSSEHVCKETEPGLVETSGSGLEILRNDNKKPVSNSLHTSTEHICIKIEPDFDVGTSGPLLETLGNDNKKPVSNCEHTLSEHVCIKTEPGLVVGTSNCEHISPEHVCIKTEPSIDFGTSGVVQANFPVSLESCSSHHIKTGTKITTTAVHSEWNKEDCHVTEHKNEDRKPEAGVSVNSEDNVIEIADHDVIEEGEICNSDEVAEISDSDIETKIKKGVTVPEASYRNYELISCSQKQKVTYIKEWGRNGCETEKTIVKYNERRKKQKRHKKHKSQDRCSHSCRCKRRREHRSSSHEEWHKRRCNKYPGPVECSAYHSDVADKHGIRHSVSRRNCSRHKRKDHNVDSDDQSSKKQTRNEKYDENRKDSVEREKMRENGKLEEADDRNEEDKHTRVQFKSWSDKNRLIRKDTHSDSDDSKRKKKASIGEYKEDRNNCHKNVRIGNYADEQREDGGKVEEKYRNDEYKRKSFNSRCGSDERRCPEKDSDSDSDKRRRKDYYYSVNDDRRRSKDYHYLDSDDNGRRKHKYYSDSDEDTRIRRKDKYYSDSDEDRRMRRKDKYYSDSDEDRRMRRKDKYYLDIDDDKRRNKKDYYPDGDDIKRKDNYYLDSNDKGKILENKVDIEDEQVYIKSAKDMEILEEDTYWEEDVYWQSECKWIKKNYHLGSSWLTDPPKEAELYRMYLNLEHKHPVQALTELCNKRKWSCPEFSVVMEMGPSHQKLFWYKVTVQGQDYTAPCYTNSKKEGKAIAAAKCLQDLNIISSEKLSDIMKKSGKCVNFNHEEGKTETSTTSVELKPNTGTYPPLQVPVYPPTSANTKTQITNWTQMNSAQSDLFSIGQVSGVSQAYQWTHQMVGGQVTNWSQWQ